ncbi:MAG: hypothetical protein OSB09_03300 [Planctomycetota bacterium]|nr:hypothetical protein [Planctomycetota bacterium]
MTSHAERGLKVTSVSLGKGEVAWKVDFPPVGRKDPRLTGQWKTLEQVLDRIKKVCSRELVDEATAQLADERCPESPWGGEN